MHRRRRAGAGQFHNDACQSLIENSSDVFYRTDAQGRLVMISPSVLELTGYHSLDEVLLQPMQNYWSHPHERAAMLQAIQQHGSVRDYEVALRRKDGSSVIVAVSCRFYRDPAGAVLGVEGMFRDITSRKAAEAALQEAERKYRELFELAPVAIFQATLDGRFLTVNPEYARMVGYASPEAMVAAITDIASQLYADPAERDIYVETLRRRGQVDNFETRLRRLNGDAFWASITTRVRKSAYGDVEFIYGFIVDITRQKEEEQFRARMHEELERQVAQRTVELEHSNRRLRELDELKTNFLSSASHELRTPLTSILGFAKITSKAFQRYAQACNLADPMLRSKATTITTNLDVIAKEGLRLARLVNDLLDVSRIESGAVQWRLEPMAVQTLLEDAANAVAGELALRPQLTLTISAAPDLPPLVTDRDRIHQVLLNLLHNAIKYTTHGEVRLQARMVPCPPERSGQSAAVEMLEMVVEDDGPGIPAKDLDLVFEKFYQSRTGGPDTPPTLAQPELPGAKGAGLGLAICKQIVEHLDGRIHAEPTAHAGARMVIQLPTRGPAAQRPSSLHP